MEGYSRKAESSPHLLDLMIPKEKEWGVLQRDEQRGHGCSEETKLELRLGPPDHGDWVIKENTQNNPKQRDESLLSIGYFPNMRSITCGAKRGFMDTEGWGMTNNGGQTKGQFVQYQTTTPQGLTVMEKESSQHCCSKVVELQQNSAEKKAFSLPSSAKTAVVTNSSQKRAAPAPVVGWPPIRSFRKNLASSSSSKPPHKSQTASKKPVESCGKGMFVKINMDGVPIGRKVDLNAYDSYEKLSSAVDELFRDLLAAQRDSSVDGIQNKQAEAIIGSFVGSGEYTLVYEDNEGDKLLVGDVPWHMFVSTVKRLRVLKSSELPTLRVGSKQENIRLSEGGALLL